MFNRNYQYIEDDLENIKSDIYMNGPPFYTPEIYENIGKNLVISILDIFEKNPYNRIENSPYKSLDGIRKDICQTTSKLERFKKEDGKLAIKQKKISEFIWEMFYSNFFKKGCFNDDIIHPIPNSSFYKKNSRVVQQLLQSYNNKRNNSKTSKCEVIEKMYQFPGQQGKKMLDKNSELDLENQSLKNTLEAKVEDDKQQTKRKECLCNKNIISINEQMEEQINQENHLFRQFKNGPVSSYENLYPQKFTSNLKVNTYNISHQLIRNNYKLVSKNFVKLQKLQPQMDQIQKKIVHNSIKLIYNNYESPNIQITLPKQLTDEQNGTNNSHVKLPEIAILNQQDELQRKDSFKNIQQKTPVVVDTYYNYKKIHANKSQQQNRSNSNNNNGIYVINYSKKKLLLTKNY